MGIDMKKDGKIGCAYYVVADGTLFIEEDIAMGGIEAAETFVLQIQPTTIIVPNRAPDVLAEFLEQDAQRFDDDAESSSELQGSYILRHLAAAEFDYDAAKESLVRVDLGGPSVPASDHVEVITTDEDGVDCIGSSDHSRLVHLAGSVNINSHIAIGCAGAVLHDIARRRATEQQATDATEVAISFQVKSIKMITPTDTMLVSADALTSLHILRSDLHPNPQIQSSHSSQPRVRESLSVFGLLQALACTVEGKSKLRQMLFRPSTDLDLIRERQRTIAVFLRPENRDAVESIRRQLKKIKNIRTPLFRLKRGVGRIRGQLSIRIGDWKVLLRFAMISTQLREALLSLSGALGVELFSRIYNNIDSKKMLSVGDMIMKTIDFKLSKEKGHTEIMPGSSAKLDEMRQEFADLYHMLPEVTRGIQKGVPPWATEHIRDCIIFPRLGFLTAVAVNPDTGQGMYDGQGSLDDEWNSVFSSGDLIYFKNRAMTDLDHEYGDLPSLIADEELEVMTDLSAIVLEHEDLLVGTSKLLGELDSLLALASAAEKYRWAAPEMTPSNVVDIVGGRHPLQELYVPSFIPNDCSMAGGRGSDGFRGDDDLMSDRDETIKPCMLILTGPNNSGKSVYMRQVAIIVYLAHVGSYVPATRATIGVTDRILTRIATRETVMDDESAFLTDLKQAAFTMNFATRRSLIIADEFGKGTTVETGSAIFTAYLAHFLDLGVERPKVLVGTHFHEVFENDLVEPEDGVGFAHMDVRFNPEAEDPEDQITFLYQLLPGRGASSLGTMCAAINGVEREVVERAEFIVGLLEMNEDLEMVCQEVTEEDVEELLQAEMMARRFLAMDFPSPRRNPEDLVFVREMLEEVISTPDTEDIMSL
ncbi:muts domain V-domain-containing protein [Podospora appendiculata]|uniref:DNA mismatch repair protein MSH5 n=1 Tax=Podospora appendiculata TaxID=314037 RepID=A0AAE1CHT8_9PEZI|nr:muts domain V-domain-containing protein [Podospora appendiculata]